MLSKISLPIIILSFFINFNLSSQDFRDINPNISSDVSTIPFSTDALWDVQFNYNAEAVTGALGNAGAYFVPGINEFWTSRWASNINHRWNPNGTLIGQFTIPGVTGIRSFTFDGSHVYAGLATTTIHKIDPVTRLSVGTIIAPQVVRYITYVPTADGGNGGFWIGDFSSNPRLISMTGAPLDMLNYGSLGVTSIYGAAWDDVSTGGPFLWFWGQGTGAGSPQRIVQVNPVTGLPTGVEHNVLTDIGVGNAQAIAGGLFISKDIVPGFATIGGLLQGTPDRLFGYELRTLDAGPLNPFMLQLPTAGATITSFPGSNTIVTATWDTSNANATYKWIFGSPNVPPRLIDLPTGTNSLTMTLGQLDDILASFNLNPGQSAVGQWDVWAFRNNAPQNDSLKSTNGPRAITLTRGVPSLTPFNLVSPPNNTTVTTSVFNQTPININWTKSGEGTNYKWKFGSPTISTPLLTLPSNNNGFDSNLTVINSNLDAVLAGLNINPGDSIVGQWAVWAYNGLDSLKSTQTWNITLKRQDKGDVLIMYDSTAINGRTSKDSVANVLGRMNKTFDLFNRGTQTSTNAISLRGYKQVILLGAGTSVLSVRMKDSIIAYLNSGGTTIQTKSKLIIYSEDIGWQFGRTGSTYLDLNFVNNILGWNFVADRPPTGANQGLIGAYVNHNIPDSTIGPWPDVFSIFNVPGTQQNVLYLFQRHRTNPDSASGIGMYHNTYNVATFGVDIRSLLSTPGSPPGSVAERFVKAGLDYVNDQVSSVEPINNSIPIAFELSQNYPNPFNPVTKINFAIPKQGMVSMKIFDITGREVATLVNEVKNPGYYSIDFDASVLSSGVYFYRLQSADFVDVKRMVLIK